MGDQERSNDCDGIKVLMVLIDLAEELFRVGRWCNNTNKLFGKHTIPNGDKACEQHK